MKKQRNEQQDQHFAHDGKFRYERRKPLVSKVSIARQNADIVVHSFDASLALLFVLY
jgi:hypothetical protein